MPGLGWDARPHSAGPPCHTCAGLPVPPPSPAVLRAGEAARLPLTLQVTLHSPDFVRIAVCPLSRRMALRHACAASRAPVVRSLLAALPSARTNARRSGGLAPAAFHV